MSKLTSIVVKLAFLTSASGSLPGIIRVVRIAQIKLIQDSQALKWGKPWIPTKR